MLIIEIPKIDLPSGYIGIMVIIDITELDLTGGRIGIVLIIEITKMELTGGHTSIIQIIEIPKIDLPSGHIGIMGIVSEVHKQWGNEKRECMCLSLSLRFSLGTIKDDEHEGSPSLHIAFFC